MLCVCLLLTAASRLAYGFVVDTKTKTFGVGLKGAWFVPSNDTSVWPPEGMVLLNHTVSAGTDYAYLSHFWLTYFDAKYGSDPAYDEQILNATLFDYYIDGEATPSITINPAFASGNFFPGPGSRAEDCPAGDGGLWSAGGKMGKGSTQGGWYHHHKIPFSQNVVVRVRVLDPSITYYVAWIQIRGVEGAPLILDGGVELPKDARMRLHRVDGAYSKDSQAILANVDPGYQALVYLVSWGNIAPKDSGYIEGQFHALLNGRTRAKDLVLGTGVEDYFQSAFRFSADYYKQNQAFQYAFADAGLTYFNRTTSDIESISAYKFHEGSDLLLLEDGGVMYWEVRGDVQRLRSYVWIYSWPNGQPTPQPTPPPTPSGANCSWAKTNGSYPEPVPAVNIWCGDATLDVMKEKCNANPSCASFSFSGSGGCLKGCSVTTKSSPGTDGYVCGGHCGGIDQQEFI